MVEVAADPMVTTFGTVDPDMTAAEVGSAAGLEFGGETKVGDGADAAGGADDVGGINDADWPAAQTERLSSASRVGDLFEGIFESEVRICCGMS
jgi:hypothetical protein